MMVCPNKNTFFFLLVVIMDPFMMRILVEIIQLASEMGTAIPGTVRVDSLTPKSPGRPVKSGSVAL